MTPSPVTNPVILLGTVLLEANRWSADKQPSFSVSAWAPAIRAAGFSGLELWAPHATLADSDERAALQRMPLPVTVFNSYCTFDDNGAAARAEAIAMVQRFGATGVKFNLGSDPAQVERYAANLEAWIAALPDNCRPLCECHPGTVLEDPAQAFTILQPFLDRVGIIVHAFAAGDDSVLQTWITRFGSAIAHVHVARRHSAPTGFVTLRQDATTTARRIGMLRDAAFDGSWTVEFTAGVARPPEDRDQLLAAATDDLQVLREALSG